ncbi:MAG: hypothetical protein F6K42_04735 [Leptolyngbya sp. SIO1D8]|nr:hypothetical protein [Leptolyngbya sp. SIO1D8]
MGDRKMPSVWNYKPWWCQPWSILLTGISLITGSWLLFHRYWLTGIVALPVLTWMSFFLLIWPKLMRDSGLLAELSQSHSSSDTLDS